MAEKIKASGTSNVVRRASATGPISREAASSSMGTDTLKTSGAAAAATPPANLPDEDRQALAKLSTGVRKLVVTYGIQDGQVTADQQKQIKQNLIDEIHKMVPGGVYLVADKGASWSISDLTNLHNVLAAMSPGDRAEIAGVTFIRSHDASAAEGVTDAVKKQYGNDASQLMSQLGVAGESKPEETHQEGFLSRILHEVEGVFVHVIERLEGFLHIHVLSDKTLSEYDGKPQRSVILTDTGSDLLISDRLWAHEIGHQIQLSDGRWNPERIAEFSKLSGWTETYGKTTETFDGIDHQTGARMEFAAGVVKSARQDNFVSPYARTNACEDFAESYSSYLLNPALLMKRAPEKFLFINSTSKKYTADQVVQYAKDSGADLGSVVTKLVTQAHLEQQTLDAIVSVNGIKANLPDLVADAQAATVAPSPLMQAWGRIVAAYDKDPARVSSAIRLDPRMVVGGEIWSALPEQDQQMLWDPTFMQSMMGSLSMRSASAGSAADATILAEQQQATNLALHDLLEDASFRHSLVANSAKVLADARYKNLPPDAMRALTNPDNSTALKQLCAAIDKLQSKATGEQWDAYSTNVDRISKQLTPLNFTAFAEGLNDPKHPDTAAKVVENAIKTGNVIFLGNGAGQPW